MFGNLRNSLATSDGGTGSTSTAIDSSKRESLIRELEDELSRRYSVGGGSGNNIANDGVVDHHEDATR